MPRLTIARFFREYFPYLLPSAILIYIVLESYQIDFRPYYVAGRSVLLGLDPYLNPVGLHPELYTPVNAESRPWSGFIYPPFAALLMTAFSWMPYGTAKVVYSVFILFCLWCLFFQLLRHRVSPLSPAVLVLALMSFPTLASFERGQIDILVCCLTVSAFYASQSNKPPVLPGLMLGMACLTKIFPFVALLYYLVKRQFRMVAATIGSILIFLTLPLFYFGYPVYLNFAKRTFPDLLGQIVNPYPTQTLGQTVLNRLVFAIEGNKLLVTHDFVHGYMNPFLRGKPFLALTVGAIAFAILFYFLRPRKEDEQFFSLLNTIHLFNPQTWIMGLVWYFPFLFHHFQRTTALGKFWLVLPIFMPPFTNSNGMLAYAVTLAFAIPGSRKHLLLPPKAPETPSVTPPTSKDVWD